MHDASLRQQLRRNLRLDGYLSTLGLFMQRVVQAAELRCVAPCASELLQTQQLAWQPEASFEIPFAQRTSAKFRRLVKKLKTANPSSLCLFAANSARCGWLPVDSIDEIRFDVDPRAFQQGPLVLVTQDLNDRLLLDTRRADADASLLILQVRGPAWGLVRY